MLSMHPEVVVSVTPDLKSYVVLNIPKPMTVTDYNKVSSYVCDVAKLVAETSMNVAVMELKKSSTNIFDIGVTVDGTSQRRGFSSMN